MPSYRIRNSQTHLRISWLPPISLCQLKLARLWLFSHKLRKFDATAFTSGRWLALALSHDGLWVFANRIFAHRVLADWRRRRRGRLLARQISGSGNAQHGDERSRYDYDDLHDANPLVLGTRTGRPSDAPIPPCLVEAPAFSLPFSGSIAGGMATDYLSLWRGQWFKYGEDREGRRLTNWSHASMVGSDGEVPVHCHHSFTRLQPARI